MVKRLLSLAVAVVCAAIALWGADTMTGSLNERLRSLQVLDAYSGMPAETAVVPLGAQGALMVEFDVLSDDRDYLRYSLTHCDASWRPSQ